MHVVSSIANHKLPSIILGTNAINKLDTYPDLAQRLKFLGIAYFAQETDYYYHQKGENPLLLPHVHVYMSRIEIFDWLKVKNKNFSDTTNSCSKSYLISQS